ncbi:hypothetical protein JCM5353_007594 [Sporobolomyces roseus]
MLSLLPPELLRQIIESTVPSSYHYDTYDSRQTTLCTLSLVSRLFQQIAQPLLRQVINLPLRGSDPDGGVRILFAAYLYGWNKEVRQLIMNTVNDTCRSQITVDQVVLSCPRLAELTIFKCSRYLRQSEFSTISKLSGTFSRLRSYKLNSPILASPELRSLQIDYRDLSPVHLPRLRSLTLTVSICGQKGVVKSLLQPSMLPSLRALALAYIPQDELLDLLCNPSSLLLLHQIEAFFVHAGIFINSDAILRKMQPFLSKTLVHLNGNETGTHRRTLSTLPHLRLHLTASYAALVKVIEEEDQSGLQSLYLAIPRQASRIGGSQREQDRINLLAICAAHKVEVIEEEQPSVWGKDPFISPEFWRLQRELKRLQGVQ